MANLEAHDATDGNDVRVLAFPIEVLALAVEAKQPLAPVEGVEVAIQGRDELGAVELVPAEVDGVLDVAGLLIEAIELAGDTIGIGLHVQFAAHTIHRQVARPL